MDAHTTFFDWGQPTTQVELKNDLVKGLVCAANDHPFASIFELRKDGDAEGIVIDFDVELPQHPPIPIQNPERLAVVVSADPALPPRLLALRKDFPEVGHLNLVGKDTPKELCIFEEHYEDIRASLTPRLILDRVADWLARAAVEELHLSDQPLEPFLLTGDRIICDLELFTASPDVLAGVLVFRVSEEPLILRACQIPDDCDTTKLKKDIPRLVLPLKCKPWHARVINYLPANLQQLATLLGAVDVKVEDEIRQLILRLDQEQFKKRQKHHLVLLVELQKTRSKNGPAETTEWLAFLVHASIEELAVGLGVMGKSDGRLGTLLPPYQSNDLDKIQIAPLRPTFSLSKSFARVLSNVDGEDPRIVAVGAGALGSQIVLNLARQGYGIWSIIDFDPLLPHNLARHALFIDAEGFNKATCLAQEVCYLLNDPSAAKGFPLDVIRKAGTSEECMDRLRNADALLDLSASPAVARHLAHAPFAAGRISAFLGPNARFLIVLVEGQERKFRLDDLEVQLMAAIAETPLLQTVFEQKGRAVPYAGGCRDASVQIPQDVLAIHAGVAANFVKANAFSVSPCISLWEWSTEAHTLSRHQVPVHAVVVRQECGWTLRISEHALDQMRFQRRRRLPSETGGVLIGHFDHERKIVYVGTILPSPPDSVEWPNAYIRGAEGLATKVKEMNSLTGGQLTYVGEWHSHPTGSSPSPTDQIALQTLARDMAAQGFPAVILIQGDEREPSLLIAEVNP